jgi:hypothetical protein
VSRSVQKLATLLLQKFLAELSMDEQRKVARAVAQALLGTLETETQRDIECEQLRGRIAELERTRRPRRHAPKKKAVRS